MTDKGQVTVQALYRPLYAIGEAALLLRIPPQTLRRWLDGAQVGGRTYPPVIRQYRTGSDEVTWAEFVEAGFLREYRAKDVSLQSLRPLVDQLRDKFQVPYPLAHFKPRVDPSGKELVFELQQMVELADELVLVRRTGREGHWQLQWAEPVEAFLEKVDFDAQGVAERLWPEGKSSPIAIDPDLSFGIPQIHGIRTEIIAEAADAGEDAESIARSWNLDLEEVRAAIEWERQLRPVA